MSRNRTTGPFAIRLAMLVFVCHILTTSSTSAAEPVALRIANLPVTPAHMPGVKVWVRNLTDAPYQGSVRLELPEGWRLSPESHQVALEPGETASVQFTIRDGKNREENRYSLVAVAKRAGREVRREQQVACASAPYFKPEIDGQTDDWKDAIPVEFVAHGKKTTISTFWNRRQFSILVAVEEDELRPPADGKLFDAVQIAIAAKDTQTPTNAGANCDRHEFLLAADGTGQGGRCFQLAAPETKLAETQASRPLTDLELEDPTLVVSRKGNVTYYEWSVSFRSLSTIRPSEGREFFLSVLVHDPDGTGVRDFGQAAGLWPCQRNAAAWSRWPGAEWGDEPPTDNKVQWGMCSSKY